MKEIITASTFFSFMLMFDVVFSVFLAPNFVLSPFRSCTPLFCIVFIVNEQRENQSQPYRTQNHSKQPWQMRFDDPSFIHIVAFCCYGHGYCCCNTTNSITHSSCFQFPFVLKLMNFIISPVQRLSLPFYLSCVSVVLFLCFPRLAFFFFFLSCTNHFVQQQIFQING